MAYHSGTASTGFIELLDEFTDFLTNAGGFSVNGVALSAGQQYTAVRDDTNGSEREVIFNGQGTDSLQDFYWGLETYRDVGTDAYNWRILGMTGFNTLDAFEDQPGVQSIGGSKPIADISFWNSSIDYWFYATGNAAWCVANVSTLYMIMGAGFATVYGPPSTYPYPLFWCGTSPGENRDGVKQVYNNVTSRHRNVMNPAEGAAYLRWTDGNMYVIANEDQDGSGTPVETNYFRSYPYEAQSSLIKSDFDGLSLDRQNVLTNLQPINAVYWGFPMAIFSEPAQLNSHAFRLPMVLAVPANGLSPESTVTIAGSTYRVFPDVSRVGNANYMGFLEA